MPVGPLEIGRKSGLQFELWALFVEEIKLEVGNGSFIIKDVQMAIIGKLTNRRGLNVIKSSKFFESLFIKANF